MTLSDYQVLQRDADNKARITLSDGETMELPVGGPYEIDGASNILVGDLWILAGQSNMEGVGDLTDVETPSPMVHSFQSVEKWAPAEEPLHWLGESPRAVHHHLWGRSEVPSEPDPRDPQRTKGAGLGLTFAKVRAERTGVPVGLIPSAHGGTSMQQWDAGLRDKGGDSLYGATFKRFEAVGGKVAGILWYQGESDAYPTDVALYTDRMTKLINAFRSDFGQPHLPFLFVQIGAWISGPNPDSLAGWNGIREAQRRLEETLPHVGMVSAIDLGLDDGIHIGTQDLKRLGRRLANVADGKRAPTFVSAVRDANGLKIRITFTHVRGGLRSSGRPTGFTLRDADGQELPMIYKTTLEDNSAVLHVTDGDLRPGTTLWYGWGLAPYCNITDAGDAALPAFGPIALS